MPGKKTVCLMCLSFLFSALCGAAWVYISYDKEILEKQEEPARPRFGMTASSDRVPHPVFLEKEARRGLAFVMKELKENPSVEKLEAMFDREFQQEKHEFFSDSFNAQKWLIVEKWAEIAPKQCFLKLKETGNEPYFYSLFYSWAKKNPEEAIAFYEENVSRESDVLAANITGAIVYQYAAHSPEKAWNWLAAQEKYLSPENLEQIKGDLVEVVAQRHPKELSRYFNELGDREKERVAYKVGQELGKTPPGYDEWLGTLSQPLQAKIEAGRIIAASGGSLSVLQEQLSQYSPEERERIAPQLALGLLETGGQDMRERVSWVLDTIPEEKLDGEAVFIIVVWLQEDVKNTKEWVDSYPAGEKKNRLLKWRNEKTYSSSED